MRLAVLRDWWGIWTVDVRQSCSPGGAVPISSQTLGMAGQRFDSAHDTSPVGLSKDAHYVSNAGCSLPPAPQTTPPWLGINVVVSTRLTFRVKGGHEGPELPESYLYHQ